MPIIHIGGQQLSCGSGDTCPADGATALLRSGANLIALVLRNSAANRRVGKSTLECARRPHIYSSSTVDQPADAHTPFSSERCQPAAVLFADLVGRAASVSNKSPDVVIRTLRSLLRVIGDAMLSNPGSIEKFLGDGLTALFEPPITSMRDASSAAESALDIVKAVRWWNYHASPSEQLLRIAIGIHYGPIAQSGIGTEKGPGLTVVGETVYIAGQVEAYCGVLDVPLLVTDDFVKALLEEGSLELAKAFGDEGLHELCGCKRPVRLFSLTKQPKANQQQVTSCARHDDIDEGAG